jgi:nucleotide-binding universal stress UspA family protein
MAERDPERAIRRILVALDASAYSLVALEEAVRLAAVLSAELIGLYVEDVNLLRWAALPFTRVVRYPADEDAAIDEAGIEAHLHRRARRARKALEEAAEEAELSWSFRVVRGQVTPELLAAALEADLLALGRVSYPRARQVLLGSTARAMVAQAPRVVWLPAREHPEPFAPIFVTYDGSGLARQGLLLAEHIAEERSLTCVLVSEPDRVPALEAEVREQLGPARAKLVTFRHMPSVTADTLARIVTMEKGAGLVVAGDMLALTTESLEALLNQLDCAVLLVR